MRKWLALLIGIAALVGAGTALAVAGSLETDEGELVVEKPAKVDTTVEKVEWTIEFEPLPEGMLAEDDLPEPEVIQKEPVDDTPPVVEILHPEDGQVFTTREIVFEGITEPGARVFFGDKEADVAENGSWRVVLHLGWGETLVTAEALDEHENSATDSVTVIVKEPEKPKPEPKEEPKEQPKEAPKEEPKEEHEEEPKEEEAKWEFSAHQLYGECSENPPYDVFWGTGKPGSRIVAEAKYGRKVAEVNDHGEWELKLIFEEAPVGEVFVVHIVDEFGNLAEFEFVRTG